jgi:hypothetical protein
VTAVIHAQTDYFGRYARSQELDVAEFTVYTGILEVVEGITPDDSDGFAIENTIAEFITQRETHYLHN